MRGKNYIEVKGWDGQENSQQKNLRVLHLISFPDAELEYESQKHWARREIITLATLGIIEGYPDGNFYMGQPITRGELATWLVKAEDIAVEPVTKDVFFDVPKEHWRAPYIKAAVDKGLIKPLTADTFGVDSEITRAEVAQIAVDAEGGKISEEFKYIFYDVPKTNPYFPEIKKGRESGLLKGISRALPIFQPKRAMSRAECAVLISRFGRVQWLEKWLYDFNQGYSEKVLCKINTAPKVLLVSVDPQSFSALDENTVLTLKVKVADREGLQDLLSVKADISNLGGPPDAEMKGSNGDYILQFTPNVNSWGEKAIIVTVTDKSGWTGSGQTSVTVVR